MTYGECKEKIRDLGFEDNSTMEEYSTIVKNAIQRAVQFLYDDIVNGVLKGYYVKELSTDEEMWSPARPQPFTDDTEDDRVIELPDNIIELVPLLASYYAWLDDDQVKAVLYWNSYDFMRTEILNGSLSNKRATITGGVRW